MTVPNQVLRRRRHLGRHRQIGPRLRSHQSTSPGPTTAAQIALISRHIAPDVRTSRPARLCATHPTPKRTRTVASGESLLRAICRLSRCQNDADKDRVCVIMRDSSTQPRGRFSHGGGICPGRPACGRLGPWIADSCSAWGSRSPVRCVVGSPTVMPIRGGLGFAASNECRKARTKTYSSVRAHFPNATIVKMTHANPVTTIAR